MSVIYCEECDKHIDTDFNAEHSEYHCTKCGTWMNEAGWLCNECSNN